jgi:hypothetical protein
MTVSPALLVATGKAFSPKIATIEVVLKWCKVTVDLHSILIPTKTLSFNKKDK